MRGRCLVWATRGVRQAAVADAARRAASARSRNTAAAAANRAGPSAIRVICQPAAPAVTTPPGPARRGRSRPLGSVPPSRRRLDGGGGGQQAADDRSQDSGEPAQARASPSRCRSRMSSPAGKGCEHGLLLSAGTGGQPPAVDWFHRGRGPDVHHTCRPAGDPRDCTGCVRWRRRKDDGRRGRGRLFMQSCALLPRPATARRAGPATAPRRSPTRRPRRPGQAA